MSFRVLIIFILTVNLWAINISSAEHNKSNQSTTVKKTKNINSSNSITNKNIEEISKKLEELEASVEKGNVWTKVYSNYKTYKELQARQNKLRAKIFMLQSLKEPTKKQKRELENYQVELHTNEGKLQLLKEFQNDPFKKMFKPPIIKEPPKIGNPIAIISALSYLEQLKNDQLIYQENFDTLKQTIARLEREYYLLNVLLKYQPHSQKLKQKAIAIREELDTLKPAIEIFKTSKKVYDKKVEEIILDINTQIRREVQKAATIGGVILFLFILFLIFRYLIRRYMSDKESFYTINKVSSIMFVTIVILIILFAYIENVSYLVTIMGFASAGIAIAMKDWFMSLMGWFTIVLGGTIHVGDRVKFVRNGTEYVGDIVDISMLRMTMQEDITLTTYMHNRRAGRMIFIPNNYIFTDMLANYSHSGLKTVWDGIDFMITFDSNVQKATSIAKEVTKKYSKGYTDITRKQLNRLRSSYHLKNTNVEPRVYSFIETYGIKVSAWYLTNAYATLTLRSTISMEIISRIQEEDDITIAYPTQHLYMERGSKTAPNTPAQTEDTNQEESE